VTANPLIIRIVTSNNETNGNSTIVAKVRDASGLGIPGITVQFGTNAGRLGATNVTTDNNGTATVTLTMYVNDASQARVTADVFPLPEAVCTVDKVVE
jgi:hypothetical protein